VNNQYQRPSTGAIIVAAGASRRMQGIDKTWASFAELPIIGHTIRALVTSPFIDNIVLVVSNDRLSDAEELIHQQKWDKVARIISGGARRRDSVYAGLQALLPSAEIVLIHDGARPLVSQTMIKEGIESGIVTKAATAGVPVKDTIKRVDKTETVIETPDRTMLRMIQTPQVFHRDVILTAHNEVDIAFDAPDDASIVERYGVPVHIFSGEYTNIKITTPEDLAILGALWSQYANP
jgi:2-C-methyl-D-erythritol 4-phosphate cytidylyltransferase